jgi:hypothetical protein
MNQFDSFDLQLSLRTLPQRAMGGMRQFRTFAAPGRLRPNLG